MTIFKWTCKIIYALLAGILCTFWAAFMPVPGHALDSYLPANTSAVAYIPSGKELLNMLENDPALHELLDDADTESIFKLRESLRQSEAKYETLPALLKNLYPYSEEGMWPFAGREIVIVRLATEVRTRHKPEWLILTKLSGVRGGILRLGVWLAQWKNRLPKNVKVFDLGGDVLAIGLNGAQPRLSADAPALPAELTVPQSDNESEKAFLRMRLFPQKLLAAKSKANASATEKSDAKLMTSALMDDYAQRLPPKVLDAVLKSPDLSEIFNFQQPPREIALNFFKQADDFQIKGLLDGALPPLPKRLRGLPLVSTESSTLHAEGLLPFDAQAAFLSYVGSSLRIKPAALKLTRKQDKWVRRFEKLDEAGVDLDHDLWPVVGHTLQFNMQQAPEELSTSGYDLIFAEAPFAASPTDQKQEADTHSEPALTEEAPEDNAENATETARHAAAELARVYWDYLFEGPPTKDPPYVRCIRRKTATTFVLANKQITSPTWRIAGGTVLLTSDSGPFAIKNPVAAEEALVARPRARSVRPDAYYLRLKGTQLSNTVEKIATAIYEAKEEDVGSKEFLEEVPDASIRIRLAGKLSRLLGRFEATLKPTVTPHALSTIHIEWKPESLAAPKESEETVAPPPPM